MLDDKEPVFIEDKYDEHGNGWMDGRVKEEEMVAMIGL